jgi:fibronectin-binding autotransporter adhesin
MFLRLLRLSGGIAALSLITLLASQPAAAATVTWDASGNGTTYDNNGSWSLTGSNWWNGALPDGVWNSANTAVFGAVAGSGSYTVTLASPITAANLTFANQAYTLSGSSLTLTGGTITTAANASATIGTTTLINTAATTWLQGAGALTLGGVVNTGTQTINFNNISGTSGTLQVVNGAKISAAALNLFQNSISGGSLSYIQTGGSVNVTANTELGASSVGGDSGCGNTMTVTGGTLSTGSLQFYKWAGTTILNISGSALITTPDLYTGWNDSTPSSTINIGDGLTFSGGTSIQNGGSSGTLIASFGINTSSRGTNTLNFNGGTLKASGSVSTLYSAGNGPGGTNNGTTSWLPGGRFTANVNAGGGIIDNGGYTIAIGQVFVHSGTAADGGLAFQGAGTSILSSSSNYTGGTYVNNGMLLLNSGTLNSLGTVSVATGTTFGGNGLAGSATVAAGGTVQGGYNGAGALNLASLAYSSTGTIQAAIGAANLTAAAVNVAGSVTAGANSINFVPLALPAGGTYHFLKYGGSDPFADFQISTPNRVLTLVDNSGSSYIDLTVNTSVYPVWTGQAGGDWSLATEPSPKNWKLNTSGTADFLTYDSPLFDDSAGTASGTTSVTLNNGNVTPNLVTFNNNAYNYNFSGSASIVGGSFVKNGSGSVTISNANAMSGGTLNAGTLLLGNNNAISPVAASALTITGGTLGAAGGSLVTLPNNISISGSSGFSGGAGGLALAGAVTLSGTQTVAAGGAVTMSGGVAGSGGGLIAPGPGSLTLVGAGVTYNGTTTVSGGTLGLQDTTAFSSGTITVNSGAALNLNKSVSGFANRSKLTDVITGNGTINVNCTTPGIGGGWVTFNGAAVGLNNFTGTINVRSGVLSMDNTTGIWSGNPTVNVFSGGLLAIRAQSISIDALNGNGDVMNSNTTGAALGKTLTIGANNGSGTFTGIIHGSIGSGGTDGAIEQGVTNLTKAGTGTELLAGANTYSGTTGLTGGLLAVANAAALGSTGSITFAGGTLQYTASCTTDFSSRFATTAGQAYSVDTNGQNVTWSSPLNSVAATLYKTGSGSLVLGTSSAYGGATTVNSGKLYFNGASNPTSAVTVNSGGVLGGLGTLSGPVNVSAGGSVEAGYNGAGTLTLGNLNYTANGNLNLGNLSNYTSNVGVAVTANNGLTTSGPVTLGIGSVTTTGTYRLISFAGAIQGSGSSAFQLPAILPGRGTTGYLTDPGQELDLVVTFLDYLKWTGASNPADGWDTSTQNWKLNSTSAATTYSDNPGDTVVFDDGGGTNNVVAITAGTVHPYSVTFANNGINYTLQGPYGIAGSTGLTMNGSGSVTITNTNAYSGGTVLSGGALRIGASSVGNPGNLSGGPLGTAAVMLSGGALSSASAAPYTLNNALNFAADTTLGSAANNGALTLGGAVTLTGSRVLTVNSPVTISGAIGQDAAGRVLTKTGPATLTLTGAGSSYSGGTIVAGGILQLGDGTTNGVPGSGPVTINSAGTLAFVANAAGQTFSNGLAGNGTVQTTGGTLNLNVANAGFTGAAVVNAGTLLLTNAGAIGGGSITLGDASSGTSNVTLYFNAGTSQTLPNPIVVSANGTGTASILGYSDLGTFSGPLTLNRPTTLGGITGDRYGYSGQFSGNAGTLTITADRITLDQPATNAATFTGTVVINPGSTLQPNTPYGLSAVNPIVANGTFRPLATPELFIDSLSGSGSVTGNSGGANTAKTLSIGGNNGSGTFSGTIINGGGGDVEAIVKTGSGTQVFSGNDTYTGGTTVSNGLLQLGSATAWPANTALTLGGSGSAGTLDMHGNSVTLSNLSIGSGAVAANQTITNSSSAGATLSLNMTGTGVTAFNGLITQGGAGGTTALSVANTGTLVLGANNGYTGLTALSGGTLYVNGRQSGPATVAAGTRLGGSGRLGAITAAGNSAIEGGYLGAGALTANSLTISDPNNASADIYVGGSDATGSIASYTGTNAAIVLNGALSVNSSSTGLITLHLGGPTVNAGTYHLIQHVGPIVGIDPAGVTDPMFSQTFSLSITDVPTLTPRQTAQLQDDSGAAGQIGYVDWVVSGGRPIWTGVSGGIADANWMPSDTTTQNWKLSTTNSATYYIDGTDTVLFDDSAGSGHTTVNVSNGNVTPGNVLFANNLLTYTLAGSNAITGGTNLTLSGSGILVVTNTNDYSGGTIIQNGTLRVGSGTATIGSGNISFAANAPSSARLQLYGNNFATSGLTTDPANPGTPVVENGAAGSSTLTIANTSNVNGVVFAGILQDGAGGGNLGINIAGNFNVTLAGANTYSGSTTLTSGDLLAGANNTLPHGAGKGTVVFNGGVLDVNGYTVTINQAAYSGASGYVTNNAFGTVGTLAVGDGNTSSTLGVLLMDGGGTLAMSKVGNGLVTVTGNNSYSGGTTISAGTLQVGSVSALGSGGLTVNGGVLDMNGMPISVSSLTGSGGVITDNSPGPNTTMFTVNTNGTYIGTIYSGVIRDGANGTAVAFNKNGKGNLTFTGSTANTYSGGTTYTAGGILLQKTDGTYAIPGNVTFSPTAPWSETYDLQEGIYLQANQQIAPTAVLSFTPQSVMRVGLWLSGYTQTIGGLDCPSSTVDAEVRNAPYAFFGLSTPGTLIINTSAGSAYSYQGIMTDKDGGSQSGAQLNLVMGGSGMQELAGANITYTGTTNVTGGTLMLTDATAFASNITLSGGTLALNSTAGTLEPFSNTINGNGSLLKTGFGGTSLTAANSISGGATVTGGTLDITAAGSLTGGPVNVPTGELQIDGQLTATALVITDTGGSQGSGQLAGAGTIHLNGDNLYFNSTVPSTFSGVLASASTSSGLVVSGGTLTMTGLSAYLGATTVEEGGELIFDSVNAIPRGTNLFVGDTAAFTNSIVQSAAAGLEVAPQSAVSAVPEPGTLMLLAAALAGAAIYRGRRRK